jgi:hypothetical protein
MTGITETGVDGNGYNGGFENLTRLLEDWTGVTFTWTGSGISLWNSRQADSPWSETYYRDPIRAWSYDSDLLDPANLPPGAPKITIIQRTSWNQSIVHNFSRDEFFGDGI